MAVSRDTLRLLDGMRIAMLAPLDQTALAIVRAWAIAWNEVAHEWDAALLELVEISKDGRWPSRRQISRAKRAQRALEVTRAALLDVVKDLPVRVSQALPAMTVDAVEWSQRLTASQYPVSAGSPAQIIATLEKVDPAALDAIVRRTTQQVTSLSRPLSAQAERAMKSSLIRGIALGDNPRRTASEMLERVRGDFNGGRNRALVIARTEMLDAYRAAGQAQDQASADVLSGWQWVSALDRRTCPSCWAQHGSRHPLSEPGPNDHQQGRCARVPLTKSWRDLGFDIDEPASILPDAQTQFRMLPRADQLAVMGRARLDLLDTGKVAWSDLSTRRVTDGWRDSFAPTSVKDLATV